MPLSIIKGLPGQGRIEDIGFSPDGKLIAMSGGNSVLLWNLATDEVKKLTEPVDGPVFYSRLAFNPQGKLLATIFGAAKTVLWNLEKGSNRMLSQDDLAIAFSPDSRSLITASRRGGLDFWDVDTGKKIKTYLNLKKEGDTYSGVLFTPNGKHLAATYKDEKIVVLEAAGGRAVPSFSGHQGPITSFAISRDGKLLVSGGSDKRIIVRDLATGEKIKDIAPLPDRVNDLDISPDGLLIAAAIGPFAFPWEALKPETGVIIIDLKTGRGRLQKIPFCYQVAFSPDGKLLATGISSGEEVAIIWDISSYRIADQLKKDPFETTAEYEARWDRLRYHTQKNFCLKLTNMTQTAAAS